MSDYTHIITERGSELPKTGDEVLVCDDLGDHEIRRIATRSTVLRDGQYESAYIEVTLTDAERDYDCLSEAEQDAAYEDLPHAAVLTGEV